MTSEPTLQYASCNEDTQSELDALEVRDRRVLGIAAAGERAFALLLGDPREVIAIDRNPAQIYLGELKVAAMRALSHNAYLRFVGIRAAEDRISIYRALAPELTAAARAYWDRCSSAIDSGVLHAGITERGLARASHLLRMALGDTVTKLRAANSLSEQGRLAEQLLSRPIARGVLQLVFNPVTGRLVLRDKVYYGDARRFAAGYIAERLLTTFKNHRFDDCFIFDLFLHGRLTENTTLPLALDERGYDTIKQRLDRLRFVNADIRDYLKSQPTGSFDAFSLSDLGGYLTVPEYASLLAEVDRVSSPGATVCIREFISQPTREARWPSALLRNQALERRLDVSDRSVGCTFVCASKSMAVS